MSRLSLSNPWRAALRLFTAIVAACAAIGAFSGPARAQTCNTNQCAIDLTPTIWLNNNMWGNPNGQYGTGSVTKNSSTSWSTSWNFTDPNYYNVVSYPNAVLGWFYGYRDTGTGLPFLLSANTPVNCTANWSITGTWQGDVAFDLWANATQNPSGNPDHEIMIWVKCSGVGPSMPIIASPTIDGVTWDCYHQVGSWSYTAFLVHGGGNQYDLHSLNYNVMDFMNWMISQGLISNTEYLISVPFGTEINCTPTDPTVNGTLNVTNYTCSVGGVSIPPAPTGLTATPGNAQVALAWNASSGATAYDVKRSTVSGSGYATVSSPTTTSYTNTGLTNGTTYYFVVDAKNSAGTSGNSNQASATPSAGDTAQYNFESTSQSWTFSGAPITGVAQSTTQHYAGTHALAVTINGNAANANTYVLNPSVTAGKVVTYHVWIPSGIHISAIQPYVEDHNWAWTGTIVPIASLQTNAWNTVTVTVPSGAAQPMNELGVEFRVNATWSGTCYIDSISW